MTARRGGFTLVELLVVITIIAILVALLFPIIGAAINSAKETVCRNNMGQLAKVIQAYADDNDGAFPFVGVAVGTATQRRPSANDWLYVGNTPGPTNVDSGVLYRNKKVGSRDVFYCPVDLDNGLNRTSTTAIRLVVSGSSRSPTSFAINGSITYGNASNGGGDVAPPASLLVFKDGQRHVRKISDFDPQDFMFIEESDDSTWNNAYITSNSSLFKLTDRHRGGGHVACMDGHVEWMTPDTYNAEAAKAMAGTTWYLTPGTRWNPN
jgi:prepilin-type N-terminal cleavage/methylation domain-containing protein